MKGCNLQFVVVEMTLISNLFQLKSTFVNRVDTKPTTKFTPFNSLKLNTFPTNPQ